MEQKRDPRINPYKYSQLIFDKEAMQYNGTKIKIDFSTNCAITTGYPHAKKKKI